jgi:HD-like signal output (HDOD) protein
MPTWERTPSSLPRELAAFRPIRAAQLEPSRQQALVKVFQNIPRPPELFSRLLCPELVSRDSVAELAELVSGDGVLVEQLLQDINSPAYGLRLAVADMDEAVALLGPTTVRGLALQRLLMRSFQSSSGERQRLLEVGWQASTLAAEIGLKQAKALGYADAGNLLSCILLACVGRLATLTAMPGRLLAQVPARGYLSRAASEQAVFGLSAAEIGRLLMHSWSLPAAVVDEASEVEAVLFAPYAAWEAARASRLGLCYLAIRLGERLAHDPGNSLDDFDLLDDPDAELHHVRAYLQNPGFAAVDRHLAQVAFRKHIDRLRLALLTPACVAQPG